MKIYYHPISTTSRMLMLFAEDTGFKADWQIVDLFTGEHCQPNYTAMNPTGLVPMLEDGDFRLTESSAILKYLAEKTSSVTYPADLQKRAKINEMMDWLNTQFYREFAYGLIYPQLFPHLRRATEEQQAATLAWGKDKAKSWFKILDENLIGPNNDYLCGNEITLADFFGAPILTAGELIRCDFTSYKNISRWLANMKARPSWDKTNNAFYELAGSLKETQFEIIWGIMITIERIDHVGIRITDKQRALDFYKILGFKVLVEVDFDAVIIITNDADVELNLICNGVSFEGGKNMLMDMPQKYTGITHIALRVTDLSATLATLKSFNITLSQGPVTFGNGHVSVFVRDPDRNVVELRARLDPKQADQIENISFYNT